MSFFNKLYGSNNTQSNSMSNEDRKSEINKLFNSSRDQLANLNNMPADEIKKLSNVQFVDVRTPAERAISMIKGAITCEEFVAHPENYKDKTIVTYCTLGFRSGMFAQSLHGLETKIINMIGGVLAWSHAGGEFTHDGKVTKRVHTHGVAREPLLNSNYEPVN